jgi:general transcription factor 3C polypeptide 3 (transcription factor C subunit 4)
LADEVLRHISFSNAYQNRETQDTIRFTLIGKHCNLRTREVNVAQVSQTACAIATGQHLVVVEQCRKLIITHQFNNEPVRILLASLASGLRPTDSFIISTLQKHLLRELKINDTAVKNPDTLRWVPVNRRYAMTSTKSGGEGEDPPEEEDDVMPDEGSVSSTEKQNVPRMPTKFNPIPLIVYGQMCTVAKSYQSAICMSHHVFAELHIMTPNHIQFIYCMRMTIVRMTL